MNISKKLLLSMVALTSIVLVATLSLARWSFEQGFADFVNGLEKERLGRISEQVISFYETNNETWQDIENSTILGKIDVQKRGPKREFRRPPKGQRPPPNQTERRPPPFGEKGNPPPRFTSQTPITFLLNNSGEILLESRGAQSEFNRLQSEDKLGIEINYPITYRGTTIASLQSWNQPPSASSLANQFEIQQLRASYIIGGISLSLTIALAFFIAQLLVKPIKQLSGSVSQLTRGNYKISLPEKGKDELAQLMRDTQTLARTLEQSRTQKNRWFADISHELRTPLTILLGEIEAIRAGLRQFDENQLLSIEQEVNMLNRLVEDLYQLSLSDLGALKYEFTDTCLSDLIENSLSAFKSQIDSKRIQLCSSIEANIQYSLDAQRFEQLMSNLLKNALKYTDAGGKINIQLEKLRGSIELVLEDSHPGVPEEECIALFETLYQRNSSRNRANSGAGLGLAICKNIVESHRGKIKAMPSELGGLKIVISLPTGR